MWMHTLIITLSAILLSLNVAAKALSVTYVTNAVQKGAVCLDGSPAGYYFSPGFDSGINNWVVHMEDTAQMDLVIWIHRLELNQADYEHKSEKALLTKNVCHALVFLADIRESLYGCSSLKEDISRLQNCCRLRESKLCHSLVLRVDERKILCWGLW